MGTKALRCTNLAELPAMMKEFLEYDNTRPILMECVVSSEHVYPMVAAGKALHEQIVSHYILAMKLLALANVDSYIHLYEERPSRAAKEKT